MRLRPFRPILTGTVVCLAASIACGSDNSVTPGPENKTPPPVWSEITDLPPEPTFYAMWAPRADLIIAVGPEGDVWQWDGQRWAKRVNPFGYDLFAIDGSETGKLIAVGNHGTALEQVNGSFVIRDTGTTSDLRGLWYSPSGTFVACGVDGAIIRGDGTMWSLESSGTSAALFSIWGTSDNDIFIVGVDGTILHYDGSAWTPMNSGTGELLASISGTAGNDVYAVGASGTILHYDGSAWSPMASNTTELLQSVSAPGGPATVGANGSVLRLVNGTWSSETLDGAPWMYTVKRVDGQLWSAGTRAIYRFDGLAWSPENRGAVSVLRAITYSPTLGAVAVGDDGTVLMGGPGHWRPDDAGALQRLNAVWESPAGDLFAAGTNRIYRLDHGNWVTENSDVTEYFDLNGNDEHAFAVGAGGFVRERIGSTWYGFSQVTYDMHAVCMVGNQGYAVGDGGTVLRFDGRGWVSDYSHSGLSLWDVAADPTGNFRAVAVGASGACVMLLSDPGASWAQEQTGVTSSLYALATGPDGHLLALGTDGTVLELTGFNWTTVPSPLSRTYLGACSHHGILYACGGNVLSGGILTRYGPPSN